MIFGRYHEQTSFEAEPISSTGKGLIAENANHYNQGMRKLKLKWNALHHFMGTIL